MCDTPGVLETTRRVVEKAAFVHINREAVESLCDKWASESPELPAWNEEIHWNDGTWRTVNYLLLLDALNFCFWPDEGQEPWCIEYKGRKLNGYNALAASLRRAIEEGVPLYDAGYLVEIEEKEFARVFRGKGMIPLFRRRLEHTREIGMILRRYWEGKFSNAVEHAGGSAVALVSLVERNFPSFADYALYRGGGVRFLKRAQILVVDLAGTFQQEGWGKFHDLHKLTAFADYKIPQVLRALGVLSYVPDLADVVDSCVRIPAGDPREVEIRAAMVWAVEYLRRGMAERRKVYKSYEIDWLLWNLGQKELAGMKPYHRTRTIFY